MEFVSHALESEAGKKPIITEISEKQKEDYQQHKYLCRDRLNISGEITPERKNLIEVNGGETTIVEANLILLLRFTVELKNNKEGWVDRITLHKEHIIADPNGFQH